MSNEMKIVCDPDSIENEPTSVGRITIEEMQENPGIFKEKLSSKIAEILDRYGYVHCITEFHWVNGQVHASVDFVEKPKELLEQ